MKIFKKPEPLFRRSAAIFTMLAVAAIMMGQDINVTGKVTDESGMPLVGVTILERGTVNGTISDNEGNYAITLPADATIAFSYVGYNSEYVKVNNRTWIEVRMTPASEELEELVVIGYTSKRKSDLTGAISVVDLNDVGKVPYANILQGLQGRVAGIVMAQDGQPGSGRTQVRIRGITTLNNNNPLYVIDGIPTVESLDNLNPNDIESIQVLKDASAASIYGSRSAAGVIVITTKKGKEGRMTVDAGVVTGIQTLANRVEVLNSQEWGEVYWRAAAYSNRTPNLALYGGRVPEPQVVTTPFEVPGTNQVYAFTPEGTDWADAVYRNSKNNQYYVNLASGSDKGNYSLGVSYFDQDGIIDHTFHRRITTRANSEYKLNDWIKAGENLSVSWSNQVQTGTQNSQSGIPYQVIRQHPALPIYDVDGNFAGGNVFVASLAFPNAANPVAELFRNKDNNSVSYRIFGNAYLEANILDAFTNLKDDHDLVLKSNIGIDYSNFLTRNFAPTYQEGGFSRTEAMFSRTFGEGRTDTWINTAEYKYMTDIHDFKSMIGMETIRYRFNDISAGRSNYELEDPNYVQIGSGAVESSTNGGGSLSWGLLSYFGRIDYVLDQKYLLAATLRHDQTSRLNHSGIFPAFSLGWKLEKEEFASMLFANRWLNSMKLRGSWGQQGNQNIAVYAIYSTFGQNPDRADYDFEGTNNTVNSGLVTLQKGNTDLKWETTTQYNLGTDLVMMDYTVQITLDYFNKVTSDILTTPMIIAAEGGGSPPPQNTATVKNTGVELNLSYNNRPTSGGFQFSSQLQLSHYTNRVIELGEGVGSEGYEGEFYFGLEGETRVATGYPFASFYGWKSSGIFRTEEEVANHAVQNGKAVGRLIYEDLNDDGVIDDQDRTYLGSPNPDLTMGLYLSADYKNFNFSMFFYSAIGQQAYNYTKQNTDFFEPNFNVGARILNAWSEENPDSDIPAVQLTATNDERRASSYFVENASFLKLRSVKLSYRIPEKYTKGYAVNIYGEVQNVFTLTGYTGLDPEVPYAGDSNVFGIDRGFYPLPRMFMAGINIRL